MASRNITASIANFREAARHLWNVHYRHGLSERDPWDVHDSFDEVIIRLFGSLVLQPLNLSESELAPSSDAYRSTMTPAWRARCTDSGTGN
jgi:hypothetical protein